ncbi:MAG: hypothetical protein RIS72_1639 [Pseudomonadota bacterium]
MGLPLVSVMSQPQGRPLILASTTSGPSSTATTPGAAKAAALLMLLMLACAWGERTNTACVMLSRRMSSV